MPAACLLASALALLGPWARAVSREDAQDSERTVYLTKAEALAYVFPDADRVVELRHLLSASEISAVEERLARRLDEGGFYLYAGLQGGRPASYAAIVAEVGKVRPITHIVEVTPAGETGKVAVMIYRESHGGEVSSPRFMAQYEGMTLDDPIRIDRDVINIAGATLSGHAICRGVRKALAVVTVVLIDRDPEARDALLATGTDVTPEPHPSGASAVPSPSIHGLRHLAVERTVMGTVCRVEAWAPEDDAGLASHLQAALDEVARWDGVLSDWRDDTPLSRLNRAPVGVPQPVDPDLLAWLLDAQRWHAATDGAFDPAVGSIVEAWGLRTGQPGRPDPTRLDAARRASGLHRLAIDRDAATVTRLADVVLDPGASGKGFALDRAAEVLEARGVHRALLTFRSTLLALDPPPEADAWIVPIVHDGDGTTVTTIALAREALSVSGGALQAFADQGTERGHVVDPADGLPIVAGRLAWVRHPSAAGADALSTALLVRGDALDRVPSASGAFLADAGLPAHAWPALP